MDTSLKEIVIQFTIRTDVVVQRHLTRLLAGKPPLPSKCTMPLRIVIVMTLDHIPELEDKRVRILLNEELLSTLKVQRDCIVAGRVGLVPILDGLVRHLPLRSSAQQWVYRSLLGRSTLTSENER